MRCYDSVVIGPRTARLIRRAPFGGAVSPVRSTRALPIGTTPQGRTGWSAPAGLAGGGLAAYGCWDQQVPSAGTPSALSYFQVSASRPVLVPSMQ